MEVRIAELEATVTVTRDPHDSLKRIIRSTSFNIDPWDSYGRLLIYVDGQQIPGTYVMDEDGKLGNLKTYQEVTADYIKNLINGDIQNTTTIL